MLAQLSPQCLLMGMSGVSTQTLQLTAAQNIGPQTTLQSAAAARASAAIATHLNSFQPEHFVM